jgi:hypothetical protein
LTHRNHLRFPDGKKMPVNFTPPPIQVGAFVPLGACHWCNTGLVQHWIDAKLKTSVN